MIIQNMFSHSPIGECLGYFHLRAITIEVESLFSKAVVSAINENSIPS
jgi:hypothetical protein